MVHPGWQSPDKPGPPHRPDPLLLMSIDVAPQIGVCRATVIALVHRGELRAIRVGRNYRFRQVDVDAYLERQATREA